jgi:hypothetical protein
MIANFGNEVMIDGFAEKFESFEPNRYIAADPRINPERTRMVSSLFG